MFWRMLQGALARQQRRLFMVALTIALGVSLTTAMLNVMLDVGDKVNRELKAYGANITVTPRAASVVKDLYGVETTEGSGQYLQEADLGKIKTIFWANNIVTFAPSLVTDAVGPDGQTIPVVGTWFDHELPLPTGDTAATGIKALKSWWDVQGSWITDTDNQGAMMGSLLAAKLGLRPGDIVTLRLAGGQQAENFTITGVFNSGGAEDEQIFVPLRKVQQALHLDGKIGKVEVSAITTPENELARKAAQDPKSLSLKEWETWYCTAYVSSISYQIEEVVNGARAKPVRQVAESEGAILQKTQLLMLLITVLSLAGSALGISNLLSASVMERSKEIGLLKALGATDGAVALLVLVETLLAGAGGGLFGYFAGLGFAQIIGWSVFGSAVAAKGMVIPLVMILVALVTLAGSLPAMRMLLTLRPAEVLHGR
ncbi:MAG TPA: ABC transporter permease [Methylomusa anaerophila]|uniref:Outer membrane-specific lipoprotein transporter subunit LolE n=1 Tax=Methylomusa anaerophila TaxID=1930071 RepID=A0A348AHW3_9FIRM|nr:ABC transporter permease [Methylomusa anaerophila]BBB90661.1 outer membrane-specific lipoprotein transporter subunit LolE [Methylomusa anaerophila]HML88733.1 ABC transporter permease [Methylomusa anaerophila]